MTSAGRPSPAVGDGVPLERRIAERAGRLTPSQARIADYVLRSPETVVFLSARELGRHLDVSDATVVRFAQELGFQGFIALRHVLQQHVHHKMKTGTRLREKLEGLRAEDFFAAATGTEIEFLQRSLHEVRSADVTAAGHLLAGARKVFLYGERGAWPLVDLLDFRLSRFRLDVTPLTFAGKYLFEKCRLLARDDVVMAFAFQRVPGDLQPILDLARSRGASVILVTDLTLVPAHPAQRIVLSAPRGPLGVAHSLIVPMAIANALILAVAMDLGDAAYQALEEMDDLRRTYGYDGTTRWRPDGTRPPGRRGSGRAPR
jgi:DNA-binding MurR/RpiR family transcriptional regulator